MNLKYAAVGAAFVGALALAGDHLVDKIKQYNQSNSITLEQKHRFIDKQVSYIREIVSREQDFFSDGHLTKDELRSIKDNNKTIEYLLSAGYATSESRDLAKDVKKAVPTLPYSGRNMDAVFEFAEKIPISDERIAQTIVPKLAVVDYLRSSTYLTKQLRPMHHTEILD